MVTLPLILLAIPSIAIGYLAIEPMLYGDFFGQAVYIAPEHGALATLQHHFHGATAMALHGLTTLPFFLTVAGSVTAWFFYMVRPDIPAALAQRFSGVHTLLMNKYYCDDFNQAVIAGGTRLLGRGLWIAGDRFFIDGLLVNGSARVVGWFALLSRHIQTGHVYQYAFMMIFGVFVLMTLWFARMLP